jgi:hypothetical protein
VSILVPSARATLFQTSLPFFFVFFEALKLMCIILLTVWGNI